MEDISKDLGHPEGIKWKNISIYLKNFLYKTTIFFLFKVKILDTRPAAEDIFNAIKVVLQNKLANMYVFDLLSPSDNKRSVRKDLYGLGRGYLDHSTQCFSFNNFQIQVSF